MLRNRNLIPLSHQHQHALALCVKIERATLTGAESEAFNREIEQMWTTELKWHFAAEEEALFPAAEGLEGLGTLVRELKEEHGILRDMAEPVHARPLTATGLKVFASVLSTHVRKEERQLFEGMQEKMTEEQLATVGGRISELLERAPGASCRLQQTSDSGDMKLE